MKKSLTFTSCIALCVLLFSNFSNKSIKSFVITAVNEEPVLPADPFVYSGIQIPEHLLANPDPDEEDDTGYSPAGVDSAALLFIEDDIATLGRVLFYDEKLSALENISCASCHLQSLSFAENKDFSEGISALTKRNSMNLNDLGWSNNEMFFWDMSETDLHTMIVLPLTDENEIGANMTDVNLKLSATNYYPNLFTNAFGDSGVTEERIVDALVHFISSINTFNSKFDQAAADDFENFSSSEKRGLDLFAENCTSCHSQGKHDPFGFGEIFVDPDFDISPLEFFPEIFNNGLPVDENDKGAGEWADHFDNLFKIPTLRNIELTAPYMHDGRFDSLEEVLDHYSDGIEENEWSGFFLPPVGFGFSSQDKEDLIAFMKTLTDNSSLTDERWSDPFQLSSSLETLSFEDLVIKPNPMNDRALIEFENKNNHLVSINVFDTAGQLMQHSNTNSNSYTLNKHDFVPGTYIIEMIMGDRKSVKKLMVQ